MQRLKKDTFINKMVLKSAPRNSSRVIVPLMVSCSELYNNFVPGLSNKQTLEDGRIVQTLVMLHYAVLSNSPLKSKGDKEDKDGTNSNTAPNDVDRDEEELKGPEVYILATEVKNVVDEKGTFVEEYGEPTVYTLLTAKEQACVHDLEYFKEQGIAITGKYEYLLDYKVSSAYLYPINTTYSAYLENYLTDGSEDTLEHFTDVVFPLVEQAQPTLVKMTVRDFFAQGGTIESVADNTGLACEELTRAFVKTTPTTRDAKRDKMYADVRTCFNNYMNSVLDVFSILSAVKRGDNVATTELMRSCPELALDKANLLLQATPSFRTSLLSAKLPLFSKQFMQASLMGFIPFAAISEDNIEQEYAYFGCDLFKQFKTTILRNIEVLRKDLLQHVSSEVASIISVQETGYESCEMRGMYEEYYSASKGSLGKFLEGRYSCYFIDYVLYLEALAYYKGIPMKEARMFKFLNLVSPVKLNRGDEK